MIQETAQSLSLNKVSLVTIEHADKGVIFHPRFSPERETAVGVRISIGMHVAALLFILLLPYFSAYQIGEKPSCFSVSLVSPPEEDGGMKIAQTEKQEASTEVHRQPEQAVAKKPPHVQPKKTGEKKSPSAKTSPAINQNPPTASPPGRLTPQVDNNTAGKETEGASGDKNIAGNETNSAVSAGRSGPDGSGEFSLKQVDQPPVPTRRIDPEFPLAARRLGIGGKVIVKFLVKADGNVARAAVVEAEPKEIFEESALEAVREWRFNPGRFHGEAVATWVVLPIQFRLTR